MDDLAVLRFSMLTAYWSIASKKENATREKERERKKVEFRSSRLTKNAHKLKNPLILLCLDLIVCYRCQNLSSSPTRLVRARAKNQEKCAFNMLAIISKQFARRPINHSTSICVELFALVLTWMLTLRSVFTKYYKDWHCKIDEIFMKIIRCRSNFPVKFMLKRELSIICIFI